MDFDSGKECGNLKRPVHHVFRLPLNQKQDNFLVQLVHEALWFSVHVSHRFANTFPTVYNIIYEICVGKPSETTPQSVDSPQSTSVSEPTKHEDEVSVIKCLNFKL